MKGWLGWTLLGAVALTVLQVVVGGLLMPATPAPPGVVPWWLLSNLLVAAVAARLARRSAAPRPLRMAMLFLVLFGIPANYLAETFIFDIGASRSMVLRWYLQDLIVGAVVAALLGWRRAAQAAAARPAGRAAGAWLARIGAGVVAYIVAYVTAGLAIYPWIADHYIGRRIPTFPVMVLMQVFRGLGFLAVAWAIVRLTQGTRWQVALRVGLTLSIVGGIAPLIVPNAFLPTVVRYAHIVEVGVSNFLFGLFAGWLLAPPPSSAESEHGRFAA
ncbi:MAG: hypothetical protein DMF78_09635 [Acidobacteria bacterium]|nr:MAG: hypothetical protein DMF78_09635 [Acidobacteriota bacterium]